MLAEDELVARREVGQQPAHSIGIGDCRSLCAQFVRLALGESVDDARVSLAHEFRQASRVRGQFGEVTEGFVRFATPLLW